MSTRYRLPNGLTVIFEPLHTAHVAAFQVWVNVGSADETPAEIGLAHLHEHMLFKGTKKRGLGEIARGIEAHGGEVNAWTSFDQTVYHVVMASQHARYGLDVLSDAVRHSAFEPVELTREIEVVCEEIKRSLDMPGRRASKELFSTAFSKHPYGRPVIGFEANVRSHTREGVVRFFDTHYHPANMVLVAVGDLDEATLHQWVDECFGGDWGRSTHLRGPRIAEPALTEPRVQLTFDTVNEAHLHLAFPIGNMGHPDTPALDVLAMIAGQGDTSRLVHDIKRTKMLVKDVNAWSWTPRDSGMFAVSITAPADTVGEAFREVLHVLKTLKEHDVDGEELATVKALFDAEQYYQRENMQGIARRLGSFETTAGGIEYEAKVREQIAALTQIDVNRVAAKYLNFNHAIVSGLLPNETAVTEESILQMLKEVESEAVRPPPPAQSQVIPHPPPHVMRRAARPLLEEKLPSGATLLIQEERNVPLVSMRATFRGGLLSETAATNGTTSLLSRTMTRGTTSMGAEDISRMIDALAGSLSTIAGRSSFTLRGDFLSRHTARAFSLFTDVLLNPAFDDAEIDREKKLILQDLHAREDRPASIALELFGKTLFPLHPYGLSSLGNREVVSALTAADLRKYHQTFLHPSQMTMAIVGDVDAEEMAATIRAMFSGGSNGHEAVKPHANPPPLEPLTAARHMQKAQSHLVIGFPGVSVTDPLRRPIEIISTILSGQSGRLFMELRDKKSMAYSVSSMAVEGTDPGYFAVYMATSPEKVNDAIDGIRAELTKLITDEVTPDELSRAREYLIGTHEIGLQRTSARASTIALNSSYGLGALNHLNYPKDISAITAADVRAAAQHIINFKKSVTVLVGAQADTVKLTR